MADLFLCGIDASIVKALEKRAAANGRSAEAEHREILATALARPRKCSFAKVLASMPNVGIDADFERVGDSRKAPGVFDDDGVRLFAAGDVRRLKGRLRAPAKAVSLDDMQTAIDERSRRIRPASVHVRPDSRRKR